MKYRNDTGKAGHNEGHSFTRNKTCLLNVASLFLLLLVYGAEAACSGGGRGLASEASEAGAAGSYGGQWLIEFSKSGEDRVQVPSFKSQV